MSTDLRPSTRKQKAKSHASQSDRRRAYAPFIIGVLLVASSWALARWAPVRRMPDYDLEEISVGVDFLVAGALPWAVQLVGIATLFLGAGRLVPWMDRRSVLRGAIVAFLFGAGWWTCLVVIYWQDDPLEAMTNMMALSAQLRYGAGPTGQAVLHELIGPLVGPFMLHGPFSMRGWAFLKAAVSTTAVMGVWMANARIMRNLETKGSLRRRQWILCAFLLILWLLPVVIRAVKRVTDVFQETPSPIARAEVDVCETRARDRFTEDRSSRMDGELPATPSLTPRRH